MKKSYQVLKWTAEVREKELQCLEEVELLDNHDPAVEFESDSESEAYDFIVINGKIQEKLSFKNMEIAEDYIKTFSLDFRKENLITIREMYRITTDIIIREVYLNVD